MQKPIISLILAMSENNVIGHDNTLPWHLPVDLKFFQKNTVNKPIIMGRKTFDSIGHPLPKRRNIILSREKKTIANTEWVSTIEEAFKLCTDEDEIMIIGGAQVYRITLPFMNRLYLTRVHTTIEGDTTIPDIDFSHAKLSFQEEHPKDERHLYSFTFQIWDF